MGNMDDEPDYVTKDLTPEETKLALVAASFRKELIKCREGTWSKAASYLVIDDGGGCHFETLEELREYLHVNDGESDGQARQ
jgi:hypothetical protein